MSAVVPGSGDAELNQLRGIVLDLVASTTALVGLRVVAHGVSVELQWADPAEPRTCPAGAGQAAAPQPGRPADAREPAEPVAAAEAAGAVTAGSPVVGTFYRASEPGAPAFVEVGSPVTAGQRLALIEAMKMMLPVESPVTGTVREILRTNGDPVEFDEGLFVITPAGQTNSSDERLREDQANHE